MIQQITPTSQPAPWRIGIDLGGTKIAGIVLGTDDHIAAETRIAAPQGNYEATIVALTRLVVELEATCDAPSSIGIGMPGSVSPATGLVQNANSTWLNGRYFKHDLEAALARPIRLANDANCLALSEAVDGAGRDMPSVFGVIIGTGCGGGVVVDGRLIDGPRGIGGEWGHNPLPWALPDEYPGPTCWCGRLGCMETWVSGPALAADHARATGLTSSAEDIAMLAAAGDNSAKATLDRHASRLARGLAHIVNVIDPHVIVLGGGLSNLTHLYTVLPGLMAPHIFADHANVNLRRPAWGAASGVRGAARLWSA